MSTQRYNLSSGNIARLNANLYYITASKYEGDWHSTPHTHPFAELFYVISGKGSFIVEDEVFEVHEDDFVIVNPNVMHTESSLDKSPLEYIVLGVAGLSFLFNDVNTHSLFNYHIHRANFLFYLKALLSEVENGGENSDVARQNLFELLLINMMRYAHVSFSVATVQKADRECSIAKRYIDAHFKENISLDDLAALTHTNKYYLAHSFTKTFGTSPINYLQEKRIAESKSLLSSTNHSISQIAQIMGFSSPSYFTQVFTKAMGQSPGQYRRQSHQTEP
ncbi:MAG: AraC family transcriptional regulator [Oscillospiraceae bacterium]|nr:AraC family transcriptional regulator [Oscillospiraceae bacterium]